MDKTYIGITYWEDGESGICTVIKSTDLDSIYREIGFLSSSGMNEYIIGYVDTNIDNIVKCILERNSTPKEQFDDLSKLITDIENTDICETYRINSLHPTWKKI